MILVYVVFGIYQGYGSGNLTGKLYDCFTRTFELAADIANPGDTIRNMIHDQRMEIDESLIQHLRYALPISVSITKL